MVKYQKKNMYSQWRKSKEYIFDEDEELGLDHFGLICGNSSYVNNKRFKPKFLYIVFISLVSCSLVLVPLLLSLSSSFSLFHSEGDEKEGLNGFLCLSVPNDTVCCDRTSRRSDTCVMKGDVRTHAASSSLILYRSNDLIDSVSGLSDGGADEAEAIQHEKIRPYSRKWETSVMNTIDEVDLIVKRGSGIHHRCDVHHDVPAVIFSTGGYTGNLYHEFNDGIIPLYITSQHMNKKVVFVILEYHSWWITKYGDILSQLSDFPPIDFSKDGRTHCFPEATLGLRIHDELTVDPALMGGNKTIADFHDLLDRAYWPRIRGLIQDEEREADEAAQSDVKSSGTTTQKQDLARPMLRTITQKQDLTRPKLVILARNGSRAITNQDSLVKLAEDIGFIVEVVRPERTTELAQIYRSLNSSDVMVGVHGAAMTHFLFMKPGSVFIQVIPLGTDWAAQTYYEEPATKLGLSYIGYKILPKESSLYQDYRNNDPILIDPDSVNKKGWEFTKKIYLDGQSVSLDLRRFQKRLLRAYYYTRARKNGKLVTSE
ncbi:Glycosyltransferase family 61 protein [Perilla frutescens var. hirtella]|uniref:Glycosyltransferase family 61 protein n=1 Tax=Perilla frutescens var. hirtella TaxID=608512 RepID=A0AAD4JFS4_PERFH|nr:Glycosyltransferase family 61 protein [Perilla frutescens var. hirtella]KAH6817741.1 Glycosyltransferase family 61 protein [Perilla frutescens var. frutescens]KAH6832489.1 Glycosyltransferase family 61 protein [Perilla frutescens var. hirtella]